jgi:hypothetical protein
VPLRPRPRPRPGSSAGWLCRALWSWRRCRPGCPRSAWPVHRSS